MREPLVSVIMSVYNEKEHYLVEAIESVLGQTYQKFEFLIVLDNPQNQELREVLDKYQTADTRIKLIVNEKNIGLTQSLNKALWLVSGEYISRMDADDVMVKGCLRKEVEIMEDKHLDLVAASKFNMSESGHFIKEYKNAISPEQMKYLLPYDNSINHPTVLVRTEKLMREGGYREIPSCEDYDLWIRMLCHGCRMEIIPDVFLHRRMREEGVCESNPYQLYISKKFVRYLYKKYKENGHHILSMQDYENYVSKRKLFPGTVETFNKAYAEMYRAFDLMKDGRVASVMGIGKAIGKDYRMLGIIMDKISYQIRKRIVLRWR